MKRWLAFGTALTLGSALMWALAAQSSGHTWVRAAIAWSGAVASAWLVPLWWLVNLVLYSMTAGLTYVANSVLGDEAEAERYFAEVRERGTSWVVVAADWGMRRYSTPILIKAVVPPVIDIIAPLFDRPLVEGLEASRQQTIVKLRGVRRIVEVVRRVWAGLVFVPLWGGCLWFVLW